MKAKTQVSFLLALAAATAAGSVAAQQADSGAGNRTSVNDVLAEVVVTAEKRTSTVQDTPISMTALSGDLMRQEGINNLNDVIQAVPGISMRTAGQGRQNWRCGACRRRVAPRLLSVSTWTTIL
jgi:iron complex outermembrane recepter protein